MVTMDNVILALLGLITIRQLVAQNFDIPLPDRLKWLLYNKKDLNPPVLCRRIYDINSTFNDKRPSSAVIEDLLALDCRHVKYYPGGIMHGRRALISSDYFINTLEASYNEQDLEIMVKAIRALIAKSNLATDIDFILFLKSGNQILANNIYPRDSNIIHICRIDGGKGFQPLKTTQNPSDFSILYENLDRLLEVAKIRQSGEKLTGIVVDCSVSSGSGIANCIKDFNDFVKRHHLAINPIKDAFVLYSHKPYTDNSDFTLHRYFDMDEDIRKMIYEASAHNGNDSPQTIYKKLNEKKLLRS